MIYSEQIGLAIRKKYAGASGFRREIEAIRRLKEGLSPKLISFSPEALQVYMTFNPLIQPPKDIDATVARVMKELHCSTLGINQCVVDPGTQEFYPHWMDYVKEKVPIWVQNLRTVDDLSFLIDKLTTHVEWDKRICLIHRDIRTDNLGQQGERYILLDFELAMWGHPYWDVARYVLQSAQDPEKFLRTYGVTHKQLDPYVQLVALGFADYLIRHNGTDSPEFFKCMNALKR
ncbi:MAG: aminoglycoside phosphotransferase family protein [Thermoflavifilum sp.]|nr:aminoglycoside phosphotransferase family protein [Thermoflavifilum sp.]